MDWIITGASRGIGRALAVALARRAGPDDRLFVVARDAERLATIAADASTRARVVTIAADLSRLAEARAVGERLANEVSEGAVLVHNAGLWPNKVELVDGWERAFAINCLAPLALQAPLLDRGRVARVLVVGAGLMVKGRFDPNATPKGADFSAIRTYASTKLAGAIALRDSARRYPDVDFAVVHPGIVNTELGARTGLFGALLRFVKRRWETPEVSAERLIRILDRPRWRASGKPAAWLFEEMELPWPAEVDRDEAAVLGVVRAALG